MISREYLLVVLLLLAAAVALSSCGGSGSGNGTISLGLTDAPAEGLEKVEIAISGISVHRSGNGEVILADYSDEPRVVDLLEYRYDGTPSSVYPLLAQTPIPEGHYQWIRVEVAWARVTDSSGIHDVDLRNISARGIQFVPAFQVREGDNVGLLLDLDAGQSFRPVLTGSHRYMLHPVCRMVATSVACGITGTVEFQNPPGIKTAVPGGAIVEVYTNSEAQPVATGIIATDGSFGIGALLPGTYDLTVVAEGYAAMSGLTQNISLSPGQTVDVETIIVVP